MFLLKKIEILENSLKNNDKSERLFFHDIINLTHGLILFFNQRQSINKTISVEEIQLLEKEVRTLQSLLKDHYQYNHKNLSVDDDWVAFNIAEIAVISLIHNYLPKESVHTYLTKDLFLDAETSVVYFPVFYRIMNNLIKNMAESKTNEVHIHFKFTDVGLTIETENITDSLCRDGGFKNSEGLGLESIRHLTMESGGKFEFEIQGSHWINRVFLPCKYKTTQQKVHKKAA